MTLLEVQDLKTYFFTRRGVISAVDGVSFSLAQGECMGLVGESGCGKSITSLSILRLVPQPAGRIVGGKILFRGEDLLQKSERETRKIRGSSISMIMQDPNTTLNPAFTIGAQVAEAIRIHQGINGPGLWEKVRDMLKLVRISSPEARLHAYPHQMSGGMKQRVVGAIALSCQPDILIADEPTTALDVTIQAQYLSLLKDIQRNSKMALIFITHDLGIVAKMCTKVSVMYAGRIVEFAPVRELFDKPAHPYTGGLIRSIPRLGQKVRKLHSIEGQPPSLLDLPRGCRFAPRCGKAAQICLNEYPPIVHVGESHGVNCWQPEGK